MATMSPGEWTEMALSQDKTITEEKRQLIERVDELKRSNAFLRAENDMLEGFIRRQGPHEPVPQPPAESAGADSPPQDTGEYQLLNLGQKIYVAQREVEETQRDIEEAQQRNENDTAVMAEADLRLGEIRRQRFEFERDVVRPLEEHKGPVDVEKVLRYVEDSIKRKVEKLSLNNQKLKAQGRRLQLQQQHEKDMDEDLNEVNLALLKIENNQHEEKTALRKQKLLRRKQLAATTRRNLNVYKNRLQDATQESEKLSSDIAKRQETLAKIEEETRRVEKEYAMERALYERLRSQLADCSAPDVMEYIQVKDRHKRLERTFHVWERKVEISERALRSCTMGWKREKAETASVNYMEALGSPGNSTSVLRLPKIN